MKIVTRKEFMELIKTRDVIFSDIKHNEVEGLNIGSYFSESDFVRTSLISRVNNDDTHLSSEDLNNKVDFELDLDCGCRDGLYNDNDVYAIYEKEDIYKLMQKLKEFMQYK